MTFDEKLREIKKCYKPMLKFVQSWTVKHNKQFAKTKKFPTCYTHELDLTRIGVGKWVVIFTAENKSNVRKGIVAARMYQTYHVTHSKNPNNNGIGIYMLNCDDYGHVSGMEFTPHYFNRFRERFIEQKGIVQPSFPDLVKRLACEHYYTQDVTMKGYRFCLDENGKYGMVEDHSIDRQEGYDNLASYHKDGISLGVSGADRGYFLYLTYVPSNMLYSEQVEMQQRCIMKMMKEEHESKFDPFKKYYVEKSWQVKNLLKP